MRLDRFFLSGSEPLDLLYGEYSMPMVALSLFVAVLAGVMAFQLAGMARNQTRTFNRQVLILSGAFVLGSGVWSMHFIGMLAFSLCSTARYDPLITLLSMLPSFLASWVALLVIAKENITPARLVASGILMGAGIGLMHYSGMGAVHASLTLRFDPLVFSASIVVAVALSILSLLLKFKLAERTTLSAFQINLASGVVLGLAISGMHYVGMAAARFLFSSGPRATEAENLDLAIATALTTIFAVAVTGGANALLHYHTVYRRMVRTEARTRTILETAVDGIITIDSRGIVQTFNPAAETIFGWRADEVIGRNIKMLMPEPESGQHDGYLRNYLETGVAKIIGSGRLVVGLRKDGGTFPMRLALGKAALDRETLFVGFVTDISKRKQMEEALRNSEQQYRSLISNLPGVAFRCRLDADWSMLFISDAVERLTGWRPEDFTSGRVSFAQLIHPDDEERVSSVVLAASNEDRTYMIEYRVFDRQGKEHWVSESASSVRGTDGSVEWIDGVIIDITESKQRNAEFEGVVNAISRSLAVAEFDLDGTILHANPNFLEITGYRLDELVGRPHSMLCSTDAFEKRVHQQLWERLRRGTYASGDFHRVDKQGKDLWIHGSYNPILDPDGNPYKIIKFASDLSERHTMEQALREAKAKAEQAAEAKSTFLANMSHEIRTPMNAIIGFTDVLLGEPMSESQRRHLGIVRSSAGSLLRLLNDILDTAKLERGAVDLEIKDFSLRDVCTHVLASLRVNAQAKGLPLLLDYPESLPDFFKGDALRIQQILLNLVGNAIKFTEVGQVSLSVRHEQGKTRLVVRDTGIGIAADRLARIFDPFAQADASMNRRFGGTGLGTTIARQLIEVMQGRIWVESEPGVGSEFHVELPLPEGAPVAHAQTTAVIALPPLAILVADDVPQNLELLQLMLGRAGHTLTTATNGEEAAKRFAEGHFDVVLMDVQMPVLSGLDASRRIRRFEAGEGRARTPIIACTASVLQEDAKAARDAGMEGFVSKPIDPYLLSLEIARLLELPVAPTHPPRAAAAPVLVSGSVIDWTQGARLWGSEQRHREAIRRFLGDFSDVRTRLDPLDDDDALGAELHRIRGAAGNLALSRVAHTCVRLESAIGAGERNALPGLLDALSEEWASVAAAMAALEGDEAASSAVATPVDPALLASTLDTLDRALARGELAEPALATLATLLPAALFAPLDDALGAFDFERARQVMATLKTPQAPQGPAS